MVSSLLLMSMSLELAVSKFLDIEDMKPFSTFWSFPSVLTCTDTLSQSLASYLIMRCLFFTSLICLRPLLLCKVLLKQISLDLCADFHHSSASVAKKLTVLSLTDAYEHKIQQISGRKGAN